MASSRYADFSADDRRILRAIYAAGFAMGSGREWCCADPRLDQLIEAIGIDWFETDSAELPPAAMPDWLQAIAERA